MEEPIDRSHEGVRELPLNETRITITVDGELTNVSRWVCNHGHPHPTSTGGEACETARAAGATDAELLVLFNAEVAEFNS